MRIKRRLKSQRQRLHRTPVNSFHESLTGALNSEDTNTVNFERLWAPWRLEYVTGSEAKTNSRPEPTDWQPGADHECFICRAAAKYDPASSADRSLLVVSRGAFSIVLLNRYPYNNGHLLIAPQRH